MARLSKMLRMVKGPDESDPLRAPEPDWVNDLNRRVDVRRFWEKLPQATMQMLDEYMAEKHRLPMQPPFPEDGGGERPFTEPGDPNNPTWPQAKSPDDEGYWPDPVRPHITLYGERYYLDELPQMENERSGMGVHRADPESGNKQGRSFIQLGGKIIYLDPLPSGTLPPQTIVPGHKRRQSRGL
jgi:hypothetical protein